jgi:hypothetical protein
MRVFIVANSLAYYDHENRWYNVENLEPSELYPDVIARLDLAHRVKVASLPWMTVVDALHMVKYSRDQDVDVFLLHVGIVECVRRIYPISIRKAVNALKAQKVREWINNLETGLLMIPLNREGWIGPRKFGKALGLLCSQAERKFRPKLLVLVTINGVNGTFEVAHPGTNRNVALHNKEIIALGGTRNIKVLRADRILDSNCFLADGIHLNRRGHQLLAGTIVDSINNWLPNSGN